LSHISSSSGDALKEPLRVAASEGYA
jgi:hypothetical protein